MAKIRIKEAVLGYITVLNVDECQKQLSPKEREIGAINIPGCLIAIVDMLYEQGDPTSLSLINTIQTRERINGRIHNINDRELIEITRDCAKRVFNYYVERCRTIKYDDFKD